MFITIEGTDGSGKSSAIERLKKMLSIEYPNINFVYTREPGGRDTRLSEEIRKIILRNEMSAKTEALLFAASRSHHIEELILKELEKSSIVICDRFVDSSVAYQGGGRQLGLEKVVELNEFATGGIKPQHTLFFDISSETAKTRLIERTKTFWTNKDKKKVKRTLNRLDKLNNDFKDRVSESYKKIIKNTPQRFFTIDANKSMAEVDKQLMQFFRNILPKPGN